MHHKRKILAVIAVLTVVFLLMVSDIDADGLLTYRELFITHTDPFKADTDSDGLNDGQEISHKTNPLVADTDGDEARALHDIYYVISFSRA
jgi:hypothetical protein